MSMQAALVRAILEKHESYQWTVQGFGMLRTKIADIGRIHIWDSRLATPLVSTMHTHPWPLKSTVISGELINQRFNEHKAGSLKYMRAVIKCGEGGGLAGEPPTEVRLISMPPETYLAGSTYEQRPNEIHRSIPQDGTVTLMERPQGMEDAMVYWPLGTQWVSAEPQPIEGWKLQQAVTYALSRWDSGSSEVKHSDACKIRNLARPVHATPNALLCKETDYMIKRYSTWNCADWGTEEAKEGDEWPLCVSGADYDALAAELAQWKNDNLEIAGKFTKANYRIRDLEAALRPVANHMVIDKDKEFIGGCYAIDVVQTAKGLVGSVLEPLPQTETFVKLPINPQWDGCRECGYQLPRHAPGCPNYAQTETKGEQG